MQGRRVTTIPAVRDRFTAQPIHQTQKRRVAAYARVSTDHEEQLTSYEAQVDYYTGYIKSREDWEFVHVYTDEGISATGIAKREGFRKMVEDALASSIDLIVTKSVSRFARNTVDRRRAGAFQRTSHGGSGNGSPMARSASPTAISLDMTKERTEAWS